jgi:hypothetical protein
MVALQPHTGMVLEARDATTIACDGLITVCHLPPGEPQNRHNLRIPEVDWADHATHGDTRSPCDA